MSALAKDNTVPAFPLGQPVDGRERYGMTPEQAHVYRWLVQYKPHNQPFPVNTRALGQAMATTHSSIHDRLKALVDRGWLQGQGSFYRFVEPIMAFKAPPHAP